MGVDLTELLRVFGDSLKRSMFGVLTGTIESFDAGPPALADVLVGTRRPVPDDEEIVSHEALPVLPACRVIFPAGNGVAMRWDLRKGDPCVVLVTSFNDSNFWSTGKVSDAGDIRAHHPGSALVLAGFNLDVPSAPGLGVVTVSRGGEARPVARATPGTDPLTQPGCDTHFATLRTAINGLGGAVPALASVAVSTLEAE